MASDSPLGLVPAQSWPVAFLSASWSVGKHDEVPLSDIYPRETEQSMLYICQCAGYTGHAPHRGTCLVLIAAL